MAFNIYLHFLNYDTQKLYQVNPDNSSQYKKLINKLLHAAILLCDEYCIIPTGFYFESELTRSALLENRELVESGLIRFVMRDSDIYSFLEKKKAGYQPYKMFPNYRSFFNFHIAQDLANCAPIINRRSAFSRDYCLNKWISQVEKFILLSPNEISKRLSITLDNDIQSNIGYKIRNELLKYQDAPFLWTNLERIFKDNFGNHQPLEQLHFLYEEYYYQVYLDEYNAAVLHDLPFESNIVSTGFSEHSYRYFEAFLSACGLKYVLDFDDNNLMALRDKPEFFCLLDFYRKTEFASSSDISSYKTQIQRKIREDPVLNESISALKNCDLYVLPYKSVNANLPQPEIIEDKEKYVILVSTDSEYKTLVDYLRCNGYVTTNDNVEDLYYIKTSTGNGIEIDIVKTQMGGVQSGATFGTVNKIITKLNPKAIILGGICWGVEDGEDNRTLGDVLISTKVWNYETAKIFEDRTEHRGDTYSASPALLQLFERNAVNWENTDFKVFFGEYASGEKIINNLDFRNELNQGRRSLVGGDMEGFALFSACMGSKTECIIVKGISDWAKQKDDKTQSLAANNSFAFILEALNSIRL